MARHCFFVLDGQQYSSYAKELLKVTKQHVFHVTMPSLLQKKDCESNHTICF